MYKKINTFNIESFPFNGFILNYQEFLLSVLITIILIYFGITSIFYDAEILPSRVDGAIESLGNQGSPNHIDSLSNLSAQKHICKFINDFNEIIYDGYELNSAQIFYERFLQLLSESFFLNSINISYQFLFLIYKKILVSKINGLSISHLQELSKVMLYKLKIPKYTLIKCYSEIIKLDDSILSKEQKNFFIGEQNRLQVIMNRERTILLKNIKLYIVRVVEKMKLALKMLVFLF
ncbi:uncharacterized protein cubi_00624 [Cryptosporidium ubiquitum]|uniref:Uncharacterized protein n=1 Tax=Cryptosporidium ubiquitum TaxID=857276 RepID=A0A1J4MC54_9CRYT|nr:uncharacterized protein cubi_00624 [Cryptosporidium ubiquitum]OII71816.1 hypothetical protein cubi_00624 [Cryptosporidium ubiquitum]